MVFTVVKMIKSIFRFVLTYCTEVKMCRVYIVEHDHRRKHYKMLSSVRVFCSAVVGGGDWRLMTSSGGGMRFFVLEMK